MTNTEKRRKRLQMLREREFSKQQSREQRQQRMIEAEMLRQQQAILEAPAYYKRAEKNRRNALSYEVLKQLGVAPDHLPKRQRLSFSRKVIEALGA